MAEVLSRAVNAKAPEADLLRADRTLGDAVRQVRASMALPAERSGVDLRIDVEPDAALLPAGPLQSVLTNTIRNAIEACTGEGLTSRCVTATISLDVDGSALKILVADTGHGLDREPEDGQTTKPHGHGLGLGICRDIVAQLEGSMKLTNAPFDRGAVLEVFIPIANLRSA
jgi:signal transduction histidine kinase